MQPVAVAVNQSTNKAYVANAGGTNAAGANNPGSITVIDGSSYSATSIINPKAMSPYAVGMNAVTDEIYVANLDSGNLTVLNGAGTPTTHTLWLLPVPNVGTGTVASQPAGISCGASCWASFAVGTAVSLSAAGGSTAKFDGWSAPCSGTGSCALVANEDQFVTAVFSLTVPNLVGLTQAAATAAITNAALCVGNVTQGSANGVAPGNVISESPAAGIVVAAGSAVNLFVSDDDVVPSVVGGTISAASAAITGRGLTIGTIAQQSSSTVSSGNVISESPGAGSYVGPGSSVNLVVSTGSPSGGGGGAQVAVPNVEGRTQAAATTAITGAGLVVGTVTQQSSSTVASGDVISESPAAGSGAASDSAVNLVVSSGSSTGGGNGGGSGGGGYGGGGGTFDWLTLGALLSCLSPGLRKSMRVRFRTDRP